MSGDFDGELTERQLEMLLDDKEFRIAELEEFIRWMAANNVVMQAAYVSPNPDHPEWSTPAEMRDAGCGCCGCRLVIPPEMQAVFESVVGGAK